MNRQGLRCPRRAHPGRIGGLDGRRFTAFDQRHGLPRGDVLAITEDLEGDLWFATTGGLARLRGGAFETFTERDGLPARTGPPDS